MIKELPLETQLVLEQLSSGEVTSSQIHARRVRYKKSGKFDKFIKLGIALSIHKDLIATGVSL